MYTNKQAALRVAGMGNTHHTYFGFDQRGYKRRVAYIAVGCVIAAVALGMPWPSGKAMGTVSHAVYVWQRHWTEEVVDAAEVAAPAVACFMVLTGELEQGDEGPHYVRMRVDWEALSLSDRGVWLVFRVAPRLLNREIASKMALTARMAEACHTARDAGVSVLGVQLDYDSPTAELDAYATLIETLQQDLPGVPLSITALPTWLPHAAFRRLVRGLDHFVLQVHGIERPRDSKDPLVLCDAARIPAWLEQAARVGVPYYVALPTYGYRAFYEPSGAFAFFGAESATITLPGWTHRDVHAKPVVMAGVVRALTEALPRHCRGVAWFRLPVATDMFNWCWPTLEALMSGETLEMELVVEVRTPRENLFEVWVENRGPRHSGPVLISVVWEAGTLRAMDAVNAFQIQAFESQNRLEISGPVPVPGAERMAAWWVAAPAANGQRAHFYAALKEVLP